MANSDPDISRSRRGQKCVLSPLHPTLRNYDVHHPALSEVVVVVIVVIIIIIIIIIIFSVALRPNAGHGLLILEVF